MNSQIDLLQISDLLEEHGFAEYADGFRHPFWRIGQAYYVRCAVYSVVGRLSYISDGELVMDQASYVGTDGRFGEAIENGFPAEAEYEFSGRMMVNRQAINDASEWKHDLPTSSR